MDFVVPVDHKVKIKETENIHIYLDLARELNPTKLSHSPPQILKSPSPKISNKLWNTKGKATPFAVGAFSLVSKDFEKDRKKLKSEEGSRPPDHWLEYCEESWRLEETYSHFDTSENH